VLLTIDGGPRFSGPRAGAGYEPLKRKRCAAPENRKGEMRSKKHAMEQIVGELLGQNANRQGSDGGKWITSRAWASRLSLAERVRRTEA
jgi:hypothetical protein